MGFLDKLYDWATDGRLAELRESVAKYDSFIKALGDPEGRPVIDGQQYDEGPRVQIPRYAQNINEYYRIVYQCAVAATCISNLRGEIFRRGYTWEEKYSAKCTNPECGHEFEDIDAMQPCPECNSQMSPPPEGETNYAEKLFTHCNDNGQGILDVFGEMEDDVNIVDDRYMIVRQRYQQDEQGNVIVRQVVEVLSGDPRVMRMVADATGKLGGVIYTCLQHRNVHLKDKTAVCPECGKPLFDVHYIALKPGGSKDEPQHCYVEGEVFHKSKYHPSLLYGKAPAETLWNEMAALIYMTRWQRALWEKGRHPKGVVHVTTMNPESLRASWKVESDKVKGDPHYIPLIISEPMSSDKKGEINFVPFMPGLNEMQYGDVRDELRTRISAYYGVSNVFMGDTSTSGGLNNEGMQVLVTNRAAERGQHPYNNYFFPELNKLLGIKGHICKLLPSEEKDEMAELEREQLKINNASAMKALGFSVTRDEKGEFEYSDVPEQETQPEPFSPSVTRPDGNLPVASYGGSPAPPTKMAKRLEDDKTKGLCSSCTHSGYVYGFKPWCSLHRQPIGAGQKECSDYEKYRVTKSEWTGLRDKARIANEIRDDLREILTRTIETYRLAGRDPSTVADDIAKIAIDRMRKVIEADLRYALDTGWSDVIAHASKKDIKTPDETFIARIKDASLWRAFSGLEQDLSRKMSEAIKELLTTAGGASTDRMIDGMMEIASLERSRLENIARTETHKFIHYGRELAWKALDPEDVGRYDWIGPDDKRTTEVCKAIKARVKAEGKGNGVPLAVLKRIINEEAKKANPDWDAKGWTPHNYCRHTAVMSGWRET